MHGSAPLRNGRSARQQGPTQDTRDHDEPRPPDQTHCPRHHPGVDGALAAAVVIHLAGTPASTDPGLSNAVSQLAERLDRIEASLEGIPRGPGAGLPIEGQAMESLRLELDRRILAIEDRLAEIQSPGNPESSVSEAEQELLAESWESDLDPVHPLPLTHTSERGVSPWGEQIAVAVENQYAADPFFASFGGELSTDCRQTTCKLTWTMPPPENLDPAELDIMQSTAHYELASLAAEDGRGIGEIRFDADMSGPAPYVSVYLNRPD